MANITTLLAGIQKLILELFMMFRSCLWCVPTWYVAGGVLFGNVTQSLWTVKKRTLSGVEIGQLHEFSWKTQYWNKNLHYTSLPQVESMSCFIKYPTQFKDMALRLHRYTFKQLSSSSCLSMKSGTTDLHPSLVSSVSSNKHRWQGIF